MIEAPYLCGSEKIREMAKTKCSKCKEKIDAVLCQCCQAKPFIDNGLLMYISTYSARAARLNIKNAVMNFYPSDAVAAARQVLEDNVKDVIPDHSAIGVKRTDSVRRTASDAMLDDILDMFCAIDKVDDVTLPSFVCSDARQLPPAGPEEAGSLMTVLETLATQQRQIKQMQESMNEMRVDLLQVQSKSSTVDVEVVATSTIAVEPAGSRETPTPPNQIDSPEVTLMPNIVSPGVGRLYSGAVQHKPQSTSDKDTKFQSQLKRPNKGQNRDAKKPTGNKQVKIGGTGESNALRAGPSNFQMQITNVNSELGDDDIRSYLSGHGVNASSIEDTSSDGWETKRFLLTLSMDDYEKVMKPEFWPKKIYFKRWYPARVKQQLK